MLLLSSNGMEIARWCSMHFLQGKIATQTVKGGNTEEFYHKENAEHINKEHYNPLGTLNKSTDACRYAS